MNIFLYIYNFLTILVFSLLFPLYWLLRKHFENSNFILSQRLGLYSGLNLSKISGYTTIWIHVSSVGEVKIAAQIIDNLQNKFRKITLVLSTATVSGNQYAKKLIQNKAVVIFAPVDLYFCVRCALTRIKPNVIAYVETEIWPNWINQAHKFGVATVFLNGRVSNRSAKVYRRARFLLKPTFSKVSVFSMISQDDKLRIISMGAPSERVVVNGNAKFDIREDDYKSDVLERMHGVYELFDDSPVFLAGSTRGSEEELVIDAYMKVRCVFPDIILIIAPRHLRRVGRIEKLIRLKGLSFIRRSSLGSGLFREQVIILDTIGELTASYSVATVVFCGASLVELGGQNIMEAAAWAKPVIHGPFMDDFSDAVDLLQRAKASIQVESSAQLSGAIMNLLSNVNYAKQVGIMAKKIVLANQGASEKHAQILGEFIEK